MSTLFSKRCVAKECLKVCGCTDFFIPALCTALETIFCKFLVVSFTSDWLFPPYQSMDIVKALMNNDKEVSYCNIATDYGHDAFLLEMDSLARLVRGFLKHV